MTRSFTSQWSRFHYFQPKEINRAMITVIIITIMMIITTIPGSNSSAAMPSPIRASPNSLLVLRQQQLAPAGDPSSQLPCYTISSSLFSFLVIRSHFRRYLTRPACTQWPTCSWSQRRKAATPASIVALPGMRSLISIFDYFSLLLSLRVCGKNRSEAT